MYSDQPAHAAQTPPVAPEYTVIARQVRCFDTIKNNYIGALPLLDKMLRSIIS